MMEKTLYLYEFGLYYDYTIHVFAYDYDEAFDLLVEYERKQGREMTRDKEKVRRFNVGRHEIKRGVSEGKDGFSEYIE